MIDLIPLANFTACWKPYPLVLFSHESAVEPRSPESTACQCWCRPAILLPCVTSVHKSQLPASAFGLEWSGPHPLRCSTKPFPEIFFPGSCALSTGPGRQSALASLSTGGTGVFQFQDGRVFDKMRAQMRLILDIFVRIMQTVPQKKVGYDIE